MQSPPSFYRHCLCQWPNDEKLMWNLSSMKWSANNHSCTQVCPNGVTTVLQAWNLWWLATTFGQCFVRGERKLAGLLNWLSAVVEATLLSYLCEVVSDKNKLVIDKVKLESTKRVFFYIYFFCIMGQIFFIIWIWFQSYLFFCIFVDFLMIAF